MPITYCAYSKCIGLCRRGACCEEHDAWCLRLIRCHSTSSSRLPQWLFHPTTEPQTHPRCIFLRVCVGSTGQHPLSSLSGGGRLWVQELLAGHAWHEHAGSAGFWVQVNHRQWSKAVFELGDARWLRVLSISVGKEDGEEFISTARLTYVNRSVCRRVCQRRCHYHSVGYLTSGVVGEHD